MNAKGHFNRSTNADSKWIECNVNRESIFWRIPVRNGQWQNGEKSNIALLQSLQQWKRLNKQWSKFVSFYMMMIYGTFLPSLRCIYANSWNFFWMNFAWGPSIWLHEIFIRRNECKRNETVKSRVSMTFELLELTWLKYLNHAVSKNRNDTCYIDLKSPLHVSANTNLYTYFWVWFWFDMKYDFLCELRVLSGGKYFIYFHSNTLSGTLSKMKWSLTRKMTLSVCHRSTCRIFAVFESAIDFTIFSSEFKVKKQISCRKRLHRWQLYLLLSHDDKSEDGEN